LNGVAGEDAREDSRLEASATWRREFGVAGEDAREDSRLEAGATA
jgi:hypothetical protein